MPHSTHDIHNAMGHVGGRADHAAKKVALFDTIQGMVIASTNEGRANGLNEAAVHGVPLAAAEAIVSAALKDFVETTQHFNTMRSQILAVDLL